MFHIIDYDISFKSFSLSLRIPNCFLSIYLFLVIYLGFFFYLDELRRRCSPSLPLRVKTMALQMGVDPFDNKILLDGVFSIFIQFLLRGRAQMPICCGTLTLSI